MLDGTTELTLELDPKTKLLTGYVVQWTEERAHSTRLEIVIA